MLVIGGYMKRHLLEQLLVLTDQQTSALKKKDLHKFEELMAKKQRIMDEVDKLHIQNPETKLDKCEDLVEKTIKLDQKNRQEFNRQYEEVKGKLSKMRKEQRVAQVYNNPYDISYEEGVFFDKK